MKSVTEIFLELVQINSPSGQEDQVRQYIIDFISPLGFDTKVDPVGNLYAAPQRMKKRIDELFVLCAHMDTVQPGEEIIPVISDGVIHSKGETILGADNKASVASILAYLQEKQPTKVELLFTVKEETGGGIEHFPFEWLRSKKGYIFDHAAPLGRIIKSSPFIVNFSVEFFGKAAHAKNPSEGISAVLPLAKYIGEFPTDQYPDLLINFAQLSGGEGANVVPSQAKVAGEVRSFSQESFRMVLSALEQFGGDVAKEYGVQFSWKTEGFCPGYITSEGSQSLVKAQSILQKLGYDSELVESHGVSDANIFQSKGIDVLVLSDGVQNPHSTQERIAVKDLQSLATLVKKLSE